MLISNILKNDAHEQVTMKPISNLVMNNATDLFQIIFLLLQLNTHRLKLSLNNRQLSLGLLALEV